MGALTRTWPALFAWGSGLVHIALAASISAGTGGSTAIVVMAVLLLLGAAELAWGVASLRAGHPVMSRTRLAGALAGVILAAAAIAVGCSPFAVAASVVLTVAAVRFSSRSKTPDRSRPWTATAGVASGAVLVAALLTPALSSTDGVAHLGEVPTGGHGIHSHH